MYKKTRLAVMGLQEWIKIRIPQKTQAKKVAMLEKNIDIGVGSPKWIEHLRFSNLRFGRGRGCLPFRFRNRS